MGWIRFSFHQKVFVSYMCVCWHHHHHQEHFLYVIIGVYVYCVISYQWLWFESSSYWLIIFLFFVQISFFSAIFNRNFYVNLYFFITHAFSSNNSIFLFFKTRLIRKKKLIKFTQIYKSMINGCGSVWLTTHIYVKLAWNTVILFLSYN